MVTGVTRNFDQALEEVLRVIDPAPGGRIMGMSIVLTKGRTLFVADTNVTEMPDAEELVEIACEAARDRARGSASLRGSRSCPTPRSAIRMGDRSDKVREAVGDAGQPRRRRTSNTRARCRRNWRSIPSGGQLPVHAAHRRGQRADHAGDPLGLDLHQTGPGAGRGDGGGADPAGPVRSVQICPLSASVSKILIDGPDGGLRAAC